MVRCCGQWVFRSGELTVPEGTRFDDATHLTLGDLAVDRREYPSILQVCLKASKTDPFRRGVDVCVGVTGNRLCPVKAMLAYLRARGSEPSPLFQLQDSSPLTRAQFVSEVQRALSQAGIPSEGFTGHSFCRGAATTAAAQSLGEATIKLLGRQSSSAYQGYIQTPWKHLARVAPLLAREAPSEDQVQITKQTENWMKAESDCSHVSWKSSKLTSESCHSST